MSQTKESLPPLEQVIMPTAAAVIRTLLEWRAKGMEPDPWLPFPQRSCCFSFGRGPLPIGALFLLWSAGPPFVKPCLRCDGKAYAVAFGGLLVVGGVVLVCTSCCGQTLEHIGGLLAVSELLKASPLAGTPFQPTGMVFGGSVGSDGKELMEFLGLNLPPDHDEPASIKLKDGTPLKLSVLCDTVPLRR